MNDNNIIEESTILHKPDEMRAHCGVGQDGMCDWYDVDGVAACVARCSDMGVVQCRLCYGCLTTYTTTKPALKETCRRCPRCGGFMYDIVG